jgi:hypothetical protein
MSGLGPVPPVVEGGPALRALDVDSDRQMRVAARWWAACVSLLTVGVALRAVGWVPNELVGAGLRVMLVGALLWATTGFSILTTPLVRLANPVARPVRQHRSHGDLSS